MEEVPSINSNNIKAKANINANNLTLTSNNGNSFNIEISYNNFLLITKSYDS